MDTEDLLDKQYAVITKEENEWHFFSYLADYVSLIKEDKKTKKITETLLEQKNLDHKNLIKITKACIEELLKAKKDVIKIVRKAHLVEQNERIRNAIREMESYKKTLNSSLSEPDFLYSHLFEIGIGLSEINKKELLGKYNKNNDERKNIYGNFVFSEKYTIYSKEEEFVKEIEKKALWNFWEKLNLVWDAIHNEELKKQEDDYALFITREMKQIEESSKKPYIRRELNLTFNKNDYNHYLSRIHLFLLKELGKEKKQTDKNDAPNQVIIPDNFIISIKDREIWVNRWLISKPHSIGSNMEFFLYLFKNKNKEIKKCKLPEGIKREINGKAFSKMLNALGFKGEILKAFFPKRGKQGVLFKSKISANDIGERGINKEIFLKELDLAHSKNSSK